MSWLNWLDYEKADEMDQLFQLKIVRNCQENFFPCLWVQEMFQNDCLSNMSRYFFLKKGKISLERNLSLKMFTEH